jgi:diguanylate cyclase (GGDEF)-like protein
MYKPNQNSLLIIEDSKMVITALTRILGPDYAIYTASSGEEGIESAKVYLPDIIISGIIMPDMDGYEMITVLKETEQTKRIPVIFITGRDKAADEEKGLALGCADYITKPFSDAIVRLRVRNQIQTINYIRTIESLSTIDRLTRLPDRHYFEERLLAEWNRSKRLGTAISVFIVEIDHIKDFYDTYGALYGDIAVQTAAKLIAKAVRRPADFVARWDDEEFIILLPETDLDGAFVVAEQLRLQIEKTPVPLPDGQLTHMNVSIGINTRMVIEGSTEEFLDGAEDSLYNAIKEGRNRVSCSFSS